LSRASKNENSKDGMVNGDGNVKFLSFFIRK